MRLLALDLKAFGPFTDRHLDLAGGQQGLHIVYGLNEAGKSSALRAIKLFLYGFPARITDDFLHPYEQLRVGAHLRFADGSELRALRRKGKKATLLAYDEEPLDAAAEAPLARALQGIDADLFSSLFGLDHTALVQGGEELLAQGGDVGQALFAAGLGTRNLHRVLEDLDAEAEALFLPRGSKPEINRGIARHREARRELAEASLSGREWEGRRLEVEARRSEYDELTRILSEQKAERHRLARIRRVQTRLGERRELLARRAGLAGVVLLPGGFAEARRETQEALRTAQEQSARAAAERRDLGEEAAALTVPRAVLDQAETIERLHQGVQLYVKDIADRSRLLGEQGEQRAQAEQLLEELHPGLAVDEAEAVFRPVLARWQRIQDLGHQRQALWEADARARAESSEAERAATAAQEALAAVAAPQDAAPLAHRLEAARHAGDHGDLDRTLAQGEEALRRGEAELDLDLGRLGLWTGTPAALEALPVPGEESLRRFLDGFDRLAEERKANALQLKKTRAERAEVERRLEAIRRAGAVPTEDEMLAARARRDAAWERVRRAWLDGGKVKADPKGSQDASATAAAYEKSVAEADDLADRLRREAGRVEEQAQLLARGEQLRGAVADLEAAAARGAAEETALAADWQALWQPCGIAPLPPREMHPAWTHRQATLRSRAQALRGERQSLEALRASRAGLRAALAAELAALGSDAPAGETLAPLLAAGQERLRGLEREAEERARKSAAAEEARTRLARARLAEAAAGRALATWQKAWSAAIDGLGLGRDALPSEANHFVDTLRQALALLGEAAKVHRRVQGIDRDLATYRHAVRALAEAIAPELAGRPAEQVAVELNGLLREARRQADRRQALDRRSAKLDAELRAAAATRSTMEARLAALVEQAGCADPQGLDEAERRSAELAGLARDLDRVEREIREEGEGLALAELERELEGIDADALPGRIEGLDREIEDLERRAGDLREEIGRGQQELLQKTGGDAAAEAAESAEETLAGLRENVRRYTRVRLAATLLRREIERYRTENQDPLLARAAHHFTTLTRGSFTALGTDFDDRGEPILVGLRPNRQRVPVAGMSEGTRDQLYLALRVATLERYLTHAEPLPFIVDDILIHFDDERSAATLEVLAELSARTQVILFTHHAHLRDLAAGVRGGTGVFVRELG